MAPGLGVGGFIAIVIVILILNVAAVIGYTKYTEKNPEKAIAVNLDSDLVPKLRYGMLALMFLSWIFSIACTTACTFVKYSTDFGFGSFYASDTFYLGLRGAGYNGVCRSGDAGDDRVRTAYAFAVLNNLFTTTALIVCLLVVFKEKVPAIKDDNMANKLWVAMGFVMLASTWCCLFTFYVQQSALCAGGECSLAGAGVAQVFNLMFLIGICVLYFILPSPTAPDEQPSAKSNEKGKEDENNVSETENHNENDEKKDHVPDIEDVEDVELDD